MTLSLPTVHLTSKNVEQEEHDTERCILFRQIFVLKSAQKPSSNLNNEWASEKLICPILDNKR